MKLSYNWLRSFLKIDYNPQKTAELLTDLGLEVEGLSPFESIKGGLRGLVVGKVRSVNPHPHADRLRCTRVCIGPDAELEIVCGAPNLAEGQTVAVAPVGSCLYDEKDEPFAIRKCTLRGLPSEGMICAEDELGLGSQNEGILVLDDSWEAGTPLARVFAVETDTTFEIGLTPNRADAMSHWGVARDLNARLRIMGCDTQVCKPSVKAYAQEGPELPLHLCVEDPSRAPRYAGLVLSELRVKPSPGWLQNRLSAIGLKPVNNVVDVTHYVLHSLGQPLHAFDYDAIQGQRIRVKTAAEAHEWVTLDGLKRKLSPGDLLICDAEKPLCLAGVSGGRSSGVTKQTTRLFLQAAYFDPVSIRKTAKRHGLHNEAAFRFERGIDPKATVYALQYAALLLQETAGARIAGPFFDFYPRPIPDPIAAVDLERIDRLLGQALPQDCVEQILEALEIEILSRKGRQLRLRVPAYRVDVRREADVAEELLRIYGYNRIEIPDKLHTTFSQRRDRLMPLRNRIAAPLTAWGFHEIATLSLSPSAYNAYCAETAQETQVTLLNPLSRDLDSLRQSLLFGALETVSRNLKHQNSTLKLFEFGKVYRRPQGRFVEERRISLILCGEQHPESWNLKPRPTDFFYTKGYVEALLQRIGITNLKYKVLESDTFSQSARLFAEDTPVGSLGLVAPRLCARFGIEKAVFAADLDFGALLALVEASGACFQPLPRYPALGRDLALLLPEETEFEAVAQIAHKTDPKRLEQVGLFDVYRGAALPKGRKSYALRLVFRDKEITLTDQQVDDIVQKLLKRWESELDAQMR